MRCCTVRSQIRAGVARETGTWPTRGCVLQPHWTQRRFCAGDTWSLIRAGSHRQRQQTTRRLSLRSNVQRNSFEERKLRDEPTDFFNAGSARSTVEREQRTPGLIRDASCKPWREQDPGVPQEGTGTSFEPYCAPLDLETRSSIVHHRGGRAGPAEQAEPGFQAGRHVQQESAGRRRMEKLHSRDMTRRGHDTRK